MQIQCTKKLLEELKMKPGLSAEEDSLFSWHANFLKLGRKKAVVLMNDKSRYGVILYGLKAKDFNRIDQLVVEAVREMFIEDGIDREVVEGYIEKAGNVVFTKTKDRTCVARLNKVCENVIHFGDYIDEDRIIQTFMSQRINRLLAGDGKKSYIYPDEEMYKYLEEFAGKPVLNMEAVQLKVTLKLWNAEVWRRLVVPVNTTFDKLHKILQTAFEWQYSHLHEFVVYEGNGDASQPAVILTPGDDYHIYDGDTPVEIEKRVKLADHLPARIVYNYDFGDGWEHVIETERVIENYDRNYSVCLEGEGDAPPEDVGGEPGYENFLRIIGNKNDPEYEHMMSWGRSQGYGEFDKEQINRMLKNL